MLKYYLSFLLLITHLSLISIPTCHISFEQEVKQNSHHTLHHDKRIHDYHFDHHYYSEKDILSQNMLYMSDEFIELAKTYPGYEKAITKLHKKLKRMCALQKALNWLLHGTRLLKRIDHLYRELRQYQQVATENAKSFAQLYDINLLALFPDNESLVTRNIYKNYIDILHRASTIPVHNTVIRDCIGQASSIGLEANKNGHIACASQLADFCFTMLDCAVAFDEGIYLGALQAVDAITHPVQTIKNSLIGIGVIAYGLSKLVSVPIECAVLYATDKDCFYIHTNALYQQLTSIAQNIMRYIKMTPPRNIVKQSSAFLAETVLLPKIASFAHDISKRLLPIAQNYIKYVTQKEPLAYIANGAIVKIEIPKSIDSKSIKDFMHFNKDDTFAHGQNIIQQIEQHLASYAKNVIEHTPANISTKIEPIAQKLRPLGRGNTGRTVPKDLHEKLVMEAAMSNPSSGFEINIGNGMTDSRWHKSDGWIKMGWYDKQQDIEIHYVAKKINDIIVAIDDFKFK